jgi:hypothetical protein
MPKFFAIANALHRPFAVIFYRNFGEPAGGMVILSFIILLTIYLLYHV